MRKHLLRQIEQSYDPENDTIPDGPNVTWAEARLVQVLDSVIEQLSVLEGQVTFLEERLKKAGL